MYARGRGVSRVCVNILFLIAPTSTPLINTLAACDDSAVQTGADGGVLGMVTRKNLTHDAILHAASEAGLPAPGHEPATHGSVSHDGPECDSAAIVVPTAAPTAPRSNSMGHVGRRASTTPTRRTSQLTAGGSHMI